MGQLNTNPHIRWSGRRYSSRNKSLFASFSSEKEESCSFLKKRTKRLLVPRAFQHTGLGRRSRAALAEYSGIGGEMRVQGGRLVQRARNRPRNLVENLRPLGKIG
jgi:hypothetical protein